jgi:hypothetical protein
MSKPLAIDLFAGLFGWSSALVEEGWHVVGFDIEDMHANFGLARRPEFQLVIQDVLTLHGSQFKDASLIVASPPCQFFSYCAMPWSKAKALAAKVRADPVLLEKELALFKACFRIQREASAAAGHHIPMIVENVRGAIPWVGRSRWNFGAYHFWGDVPALMPTASKGKIRVQPTVHRGDGSNLSNIQVGDGIKGVHGTSGSHWTNPDEREIVTADGTKVSGFRFDGSGKSFQSASVEHSGFKSQGMNWSDQTKRGQDFTRIAGDFAIKQGGDWFNSSCPDSISRRTAGNSPARKMASAMIAKIPPAIGRHIGRTFLPREGA